VPDAPPLPVNTDDDDQCADGTAGGGNGDAVDPAVLLGLSRPRIHGSEGCLSSSTRVFPAPPISILPTSVLRCVSRTIAPVLAMISVNARAGAKKVRGQFFFFFFFFFFFPTLLTSTTSNPLFPQTALATARAFAATLPMLLKHLGQSSRNSDNHHRSAMALTSIVALRRMVDWSDAIRAGMREGDWTAVLVAVHMAELTWVLGGVLSKY
jgi:hypothetical protein